MRHTVLLVDDDGDIREIARMSLEAVAGWEVLLAASGEEGVELAIEHGPDAMLLDYMMPTLDGPATLGLLRERERELGREPLPVVLLTARTQGLDPDRAGELGAQGLIAKPFDPMTLGRQVAVTLGWEPPG